MQNPQIQASVISGSSVRVALSASAPVEATKALFYKKQINDLYWQTPVEVLLSGGNSHTFTGLTAGVWLFSARYANSTDISIYSEKAYAILSESYVTGTHTAKDTISPEAAINFTAKVGADNQSITVNWGAAYDNIGVTAYRLYKNGLLISTVGKDIRTYNFTGLKQQTRYVLEISAVDAVNLESPKQKVEIYTTPDTTAPSAPYGLQAISYAGRIDLTFTPGTDNNVVVYNNIYRNGQKLGSTNTNVYSDSTVIPGQVYVYQVTSVDGSGNESNVSNSIEVVAATLGDNISPQAGNLTLNVVGTSQIDLAWTAPSDNVGVVKQEIVRNGATIKTFYDSTEHSYSDISLPENTQFTYMIKVSDASGNMAFTAPITVSTGVTVYPYKFYEVTIKGGEFMEKVGVINQ